MLRPVFNQDLRLLRWLPIKATFISAKIRQLLMGNSNTTTDRQPLLTRLYSVRVAAVIPTEAGQIGINPPGPEPTPVNIEGHTKYLTEENGSTKWIGVDPSHIAVTQVTTTNAAGETGVVTLAKGISASKNAEGGLDILISPAVKAKLEAIAKEVTPCAAKRRRQVRNRKRGGPACGLADFVQRVGADQELQETFAHPLTDQVFNDFDEGYSGDPADDPGWEGDGGQVGHEDEGYFSEDEEGFFEAAEGDGTAESIVISSPEEAAAIGEILSGAGAAEAAAVWGGSTVTAGSFLAWLYGTLKEGKELSFAQKIPAESVHTVTKTKSETTTTTSSSCAVQTDGPPACDEACKPTAVKLEDPRVTDINYWACSEGDGKGCKCRTDAKEIASYADGEFMQQILDVSGVLKDKPLQPTIECPNDLTNVPSKYLVDKTSVEFCKDVMGDLGNERLPVAYDIHGNKIPILRAAVAAAASTDLTARWLGRRAPPTNPDNYLDYRFFLSYTPGGDDCLVPKEDLCKNAYEALVKSNCGTNHGSVGDIMFADSSIDVGCGKFAWKVEKMAEPEPPEPELEVGERQCNDGYSHHDVHNDQQKFWSETYCKWTAEGVTLKKGDDKLKEMYMHPIGPYADLHQNFNVSWVEGCEHADGQKADFPIPGDDSVTCKSLMRDLYVECRTNGGAGGTIDAGCLRYHFWPTEQ
ncbi:hypothetical protein D7B24_002088 [Verticillium nonalfalfae]|uniref:Uncharacterized protein n=1 Tax=Verticillium nonalfalfae TaxID=1051616 RepID=A0A3M9XYX9_9PEZI|nr:uncharacterized protein D7B24_002088 [Verticillium nonalfalfae]RNJ53241.1 hypothetical protein D7B24_002088 [Verticillium nonalfalfae]